MLVNYSKEYKNVMTKPLEICMIQTVPFILLAKKRDYKIFAVTMKDIKKALKLKQYINP
jgi:hypothetical protein